ncbi:phosphoribosyltransferase family protein [Streptomyces sp. NPDC004539]|uniref:phosphoribosyltransferase n=1 Tax=Streptomyces sp. NPDC004539 TaxID=3154280 RepID=UPI0033A25139
MITAPQRIFRHHHPYVLNRPVYEAAVDLLASAVARSGPVTAVIGIAGGGTEPAERIAARLGSPGCRVTARHNISDDLYAQATGTVEVAVPGDFPEALGGRLLLVDDICGTGATFTAVTAALTARLAPDTQVETLALCRNVGSPLRPDRWAWDVDDWVVFPWETPPEVPVRPLLPPERIKTP